MIEKRANYPAAYLEYPYIKQFSRLATSLGARNLGQGVPLYAAPDTATQETIAALQGGDPDINKYPDFMGLPKLREAIASKLQSDLGYKNVTMDNIIVTVGAMEACSASVLSLIYPGERIGIIAPNYATHTPLVEISHGKPVYIPMDEANSWSLDIQRVEDEAKSGLKALMMTHPGNPTGAVLKDTEVQELVKLSNHYGFYLIMDETYSYLTYGAKFTSLLELFSQSENIMIARSFSKEYCMTGYRVGYLVLPQTMALHVATVHDAMVGTAARPSQHGAIGALKASPAYVQKHLEDYALQREFVTARLNAIPGMQADRTRGAYYAFPRFEQNIASKDLASRLLYEAGVAVIPGSVFGDGGEGHLRISMASEPSVIQNGLDILHEFMRKL